MASGALPVVIVVEQRRCQHDVCQEGHQQGEADDQAKIADHLERAEQPQPEAAYQNKRRGDHRPACGTQGFHHGCFHVAGLFIVMAEIVKKCMKQLSVLCQQILTAFYYDEKSMQEISTSLHLANEDVAKSKKYQCKKELERLVKGALG